jgi:hypothetical protein
MKLCRAIVLILSFLFYSISFKTGPLKSPRIQTIFQLRCKKAIQSSSALITFPRNEVVIFEALFSFLSLEPVHAASSDAVNLLTGYKTHVPDYVTWVVLIVGAYITQYRIFKFLSTL